MQASRSDPDTFSDSAGCQDAGIEHLSGPDNYVITYGGLVRESKADNAEDAQAEVIKPPGEDVDFDALVASFGTLSAQTIANYDWLGSGAASAVFAALLRADLAKGGTSGSRGGGNKGKKGSSNISKADQLRLDSYAEIDNVSDLVDEAIRRATTIDFFDGSAGRGVDQRQRYIYLEDIGWVDLQHVVSAAYNPWSTVGMGDLPGLVIEAFQYVGGYESGFKAEDFRSNAIGAQSTWNKVNGFSGSSASLGAVVQEVILRQNPLSYNQAKTYLNGK